jgi:hypothetical protein
MIWVLQFAIVVSEAVEGAFFSFRFFWGVSCYCILGDLHQEWAFLPWLLGVFHSILDVFYPSF